MKSIRVSLIVYFLSLLLLGLGGVSVLAYRTTADNLRDKEESGRLFLKADFDDHDRDLHKELDDAIYRKAKQVIALLSRPPFNLQKTLTLLGSPAIPLGYWNAAVDLRLAQETRKLSQFVPTAEIWDIEDDSHPWEGCQTYLGEGQIWDRTNNLAADPFTLDAQIRKTAELMQPQFDDVPHGGKSLRRVTVQVPRTFLPPPPGGGPKGSGSNPQAKGQFGGGGRPPTPKGGPRPAPVYYVQYAVETTPLAHRLSRLEGEYKRRVAQLSEETQNTLQDLRQRLLYVCGLTAASVLVGGLVLIWIGLAPLRRLSEAVSRINEKDFQLRLDPQSLPVELQPVAQRLSHSLDQLRKAFAREKQAAQDISHDLRTPLAALTTTIEVALKKDRTTAEYRELMEECQVSAQQMAHLVERLLALAKIDAGSNPARPRPLDIVQVAQNAADLVRPLAKARDVSLSIHAPAELPMLADNDKLGEVLTNLLHNAVDYNRDAGAIDLFVERLGNVVEIRVTDTGIGIRPEAQERLFERFYRADPSRHTDSPHCGLGLAIVKSYVDLMNGTIKVASQIGEGTTFTIRLPYIGPPADSAAGASVSDPHEVLA